jgi:DNA-binding LacI/PurR family transcriptional regulator
LRRKRFLDNVEAAQTAVQYLIDAGHRRIGMLAGHKGPTHYGALGYHDALASTFLAKYIHLNLKRNST